MFKLSPNCLSKRLNCLMSEKNKLFGFAVNIIAIKDVFKRTNENGSR